MKVYLKSGRPNDHLVFLTPGTDSDSSDFRNPDGSLKQYTIRFEKGCAEVPSNIGHFLIAKGVARTMPIVLRPEQALIKDNLVEGDRKRHHRILGDDYHRTVAV
jgi:hypothetical protein